MLKLVIETLTDHLDPAKSHFYDLLDNWCFKPTIVALLIFIIYKLPYRSCLTLLLCRLYRLVKLLQKTGKSFRASRIMTILCGWVQAKVTWFSTIACILISWEKNSLIISVVCYETYQKYLIGAAICIQSIFFRLKYKWSRVSYCPPEACLL